METKDRKENPLLNRVEIEFSWNHEGKPTPSRSEMLNLIATKEKSKVDLIVIKNVNTRFGVGITTGTALIYNDVEAMKVEPAYIHERFSELRTAQPAEETPEEPAAEVSGGEE